ncbi:MAG: CoA-binding protein, partial [bacterium]
MLQTLLTPQSIAVIGASRTPGKVGHEILANLIAGDFRGMIVPINPTCNEVLGRKCYPDLKTSGQVIEMAVIAVPVSVIKVAVEEAIEAGAKAIVVITAGFKETGPDGASLEREIAAMCSSAGARLLGPICLGLVNAHHKMNASFAKHMPMPGHISVISQSGALCTAILDWAAARH